MWFKDTKYVTLNTIYCYISCTKTKSLRVFVLLHNDLQWTKLFWKKYWRIGFLRPWEIFLLIYPLLLILDSFNIILISFLMLNASIYLIQDRFGLLFNNRFWTWRILSYPFMKKHFCRAEMSVFLYIVLLNLLDPFLRRPHKHKTAK